MEALHAAETIILAVKPQNLKQAADLIKEGLQKNKMLVSLLAGTTLETLRQYFPAVHIVRMMPNLALIYGEGVIGLCADETIKVEDKENLTKTFEPLGKVYWLPEDKIDALTALAGSGPAFFFAIVEAMVDAGIAMGFYSPGSARHCLPDVARQSDAFRENASASWGAQMAGGIAAGHDNCGDKKVGRASAARHDNQYLFSGL